MTPECPVVAEMRRARVWAYQHRRAANALAFGLALLIVLIGAASIAAELGALD